MAKAMTCIMNQRELDVDQALALRDEARRSGQTTPHFECMECRKPVRPHRSGGHASAHFEHLERNSNCALSDRLRSSTA